MKNLFLVLIYLFSLTATAQTVGRQVELDSLAGVDYFTNLIVNPSAYKNANDISGTCTVTRDTSATYYIANKASFSYSCTTGQYIEWTLKTPSVEQTQGNCEFKGKFQASAAGMEARILDGSSNVMASLALTAESSYRDFNNLNYPCDASGSRKVRIHNATGSTITGHLGKMYYGSATNIGIGNQDYGPTAYTPTFTGFGTPSNVECTHARTNQMMRLACTFTGGTSTATEARISLPNSLTTDNLTTVSIRAVGLYWRTLAAAGTTGSKGGSVLVESNKGYITFSDRATISSTATAQLTKANGNVILDSTDIMSFQVDIPILQWKASQNAISPETTAQRWVGHIAGTGWTTTSTTFADFAAGTSISVSTYSSYGLSCSAIAGSLPGLTCTNAIPGSTYQVCNNASGYASNSVTIGIGLFDGSNNALTTGIIADTSGSTKSLPMFQCGHITPTTTSFSVKLRGYTVTSNTLTLDTATYPKGFSIVQITSGLNKPLLLGNVNTKESYVGGFDSSSVTCSGSSSVSGGALLSSVGNISSGNCTLTFAYPYTSAPRCWANYNSSSSSVIQVNVGSSSTTGATLSCRSQSSSTTSNCTSVTADVFCIGPR